MIRRGEKLESGVKPAIFTRVILSASFWREGPCVWFRAMRVNVGCWGRVQSHLRRATCAIDVHFPVFNFSQVIESNAAGLAALTKEQF